MDHSKLTILEVLKQYEKEFITGIDEYAVLFKTIGSGDHENPRWIIFAGLTHDRSAFKFVSSQESSIRFSIPVKDQSLDRAILIHSWTETVIFFRTAKYTRLRDFHPTIEIGPGDPHETRGL